MSKDGPRVVANPVSYWVVGRKVDKSREVFAEAYQDLSNIGFTAVKADIPASMSSGEYKEWIASYGLAPALGNFASPFDDASKVGETVERAKRYAADQRDLGLNQTMLTASFVPPRLAEPAIGVAFDEGRLRSIIEDIGEICRALLGEGVMPLLHPHVGGWVETEQELRQILDSLSPDMLGFGPDTGHMRWAGMDPADVIREYHGRVGAIHIKDVFADYLDGKPTGGLDYFDLTNTRRVWAEPGLGVVDFAAVIDAMPEGYVGDYMIEVDVASVESRYESHKMSYEWAKRALPFARL